MRTDGYAGMMRLRGKEVPTVTRDIPVKELNFYPENPRIYSIVYADGKKPSQTEILERLQGLEHVRQLVQDIRSNGGLIDPLIVRLGDMVVLEGNSRLAAYRHLATEDPIKWAKATCMLLPDDIEEHLVFALLAQYHVKGKKDWAPYEKAGFIYRRFNQQNIDLQVAAPELGITREEAKHLIAVYEFMIESGDQDPAHWSYYDEFLKSRKIKKAREEVAGFDQFIVGEIQSGRMGKAMDLRDKLPVICSGQPKILRRYMTGQYDFAEAHEHAVTAGGEHHALNRLRRFRKWLVESTTEDDILEAPKVIRDGIQYELKEIEKKSKKLKELVEKKKLEID
ncbi:ParB N-terminal domain-containing protein [Mesorhizobium sp. L-8-10]|uniref:ParB N-terminal domain-containing protein n=1 Tax=Mesorhizobium sp. L-8-10 TaxID=2744523 RepID=UPI0019277DB8|nr:ParB N-terminal domain-containing protein [Mesorhizobium sp. L-8-10]